MQVDHDVDHFTCPEGEPGKPETNYNNRPHSFMVMAPSRSCQVGRRCHHHTYFVKVIRARFDHVDLMVHLPIRKNQQVTSI